MKITRVKVSNYRNINGIEIFFNPISNYIIGENNLGKSNFLSLLSTVCGGKGFDEKDFADPKLSIEVELDIMLLPNEQGFFGDVFSPEDSTLVKIRYSQTMTDAFPKIISVDSEETIPSKNIKKINFLRYETTDDPNKELRFDTQRGTGLLISGLIERFISKGETTPEFLNYNQVDLLTNYINEHLGKIKSFKDYALKATVAPDATDMLSNLIYLSDGTRKINTTGSGVQYMALATITVLCRIMDLYKSKSTPFDTLLYKNDENKKILPIVLSVDEPEVHLHPYLQRSLIGFYKRILCNEDAEFAELLKLCFDIDGIDGQLIIVTHSTDALVGDYRNLIRFYKNNDKIVIVSGYALRPIEGTNNQGRIKTENEKHLIMHFPEIKEAFFAKCAILIEGETEYGCIHSFADKMGIALDDYGICVINARGEKSINPLCQLLDLFAIPSIAIYDRDVKKGYDAANNEFFTKELCFEIEIVKTLYSMGKQEMIRKIAVDLSKDAETQILDFDFVSKHFKKMGIELYTPTICETCGNTKKVKNTTTYTPKKLSDVKNEDETEFCNMFSAYYMARKGVLLGRIIGDALSADLIPECYANAIKKAKEVAENA
jgi:putative ATP-dependent endonuclease of OLD family